MEAFKKLFPGRRGNPREARARRTPLEFGSRTRCGSGEKQAELFAGPEGSSPRGRAHDQRTRPPTWSVRSAPIAAPAPPRAPACNSAAMQLHLDEIATSVAPRRSTSILASLDQAGWPGAIIPGFPPTSPPAISAPPPRAPELTAKKTLAVYAACYSNRVFKSLRLHSRFTVCYSWNTLIDQPWKYPGNVHCPTRLGDIGPIPL